MSVTSGKYASEGAKSKSDLLCTISGTVTWRSSSRGPWKDEKPKGFSKLFAVRWNILGIMVTLEVSHFSRQENATHDHAKIVNLSIVVKSRTRRTVFVVERL